ncbi:Sec23 protein, putative, partial [Entamoeba invadens IP1]
MTQNYQNTTQQITDKPENHGMDADQIEDIDGVRLTWNVWPSTKGDSEKFLDIPIGLIYQPLKGQITTNNQIQYTNQPITCSCGCIINPWCQVDYQSQNWICPLCNSRNQLPNDPRCYQSTTVEYVTLPQTQQPTSLLFLIDTTAPQQELDALKSTISLSLATIPQSIHVGLIVYGKHISVYDMSSTQCPRAYMLSGQKAYTAESLTTILTTRVINQLLAPLSECEFALMNLLEDLSHDEWSVPDGRRPLRCNGAALSAAAALLEARNIPGSIHSFVSGPCTFGPGL